MIFRTLLLNIRAVFCIIFGLMLAVSTSAAQNSNGRIVVNATGEAVTNPDQLEILAILSVKEKTPAEAGEEFSKKREQLLNALNPMDFPDLEVKSLGKKIANTQTENNMVVVFEPGGGAAPKEVSYTAKESLRIVVKQRGEDFTKGIDLLTRVEEQVAKCGGSIGKPPIQYMPVSDTNSLIFGSLSDRTKVTEDAWADAISKARVKAAALARLSGMTLGKIVSVKESSDSEQPWPEFYASIAGLGDGNSGSIGEISVKATLVIEFAAE